MSDIFYHGPVVAFDLDDTLFTERDFCRSGFLYILSDIPEEKRTLVYNGMCEALKMNGNPFDVLADKLYDPNLHGVDREKWIKTEIEKYRSHRPARLEIYIDALRLMTSLKEKGVRMALVTDGRSVTQRRKIDALGLKEFIPDDNIYISEEVGEDKLNPKSFVEIVRKYPEAGTFYYIGNNERKDFLQPNLLGWTTIKLSPRHDAVHPDYKNPDPLGRPAYIIDDMMETEKILF